VRVLDAVQQIQGVDLWLVAGLVHGLHGQQGGDGWTGVQRRAHLVQQDVGVGRAKGLAGQLGNALVVR